MWILDQVQNDGVVVGLDLLSAKPLTSGLRIKSAMAGLMAGMTLGVPLPVDTALKPV